MIKRNEMIGTVTLSIADFDELTDKNNSIQASLKKERDAVDELEEKVLKGMVKFTPSYYGAPWDEGAYWMSAENAVAEIAKTYEENYRKADDKITDRVESRLSSYSVWELLKWKWEKNK